GAGAARPGAVSRPVDRGGAGGARARPGAGYGGALRERQARQRLAGGAGDGSDRRGVAAGGAGAGGGGVSRGGLRDGDRAGAVLGRERGGARVSDAAPARGDGGVRAAVGGAGVHGVAAVASAAGGRRGASLAAGLYPQGVRQPARERAGEVAPGDVTPGVGGRSRVEAWRRMHV